MFSVSVLQSDAFTVFFVALNVILNPMPFTDRNIQKHNEAMLCCCVKNNSFALHSHNLHRNIY